MTDAPPVEGTPRPTDPQPMSEPSDVTVDESRRGKFEYVLHLALTTGIHPSLSDEDMTEDGKVVDPWEAPIRDIFEVLAKHGIEANGIELSILTGLWDMTTDPIESLRLGTGVEELAPGTVD